VFRSFFNDCLSNMIRVLEDIGRNVTSCLKLWIILGHIISRDGIKVDKAKTDLIVNLPPSTCVKEMRSFLRHADFYRHFIRDLSKIMKPLTNLLAKDVPFYFSEECLVAFTKLKEALNSATVLHPLIWENHLC